MKNELAILFLFAILPFSTAVTGQEPLPQVLIIGDRVYQQAASAVAKELKPKAKVVFAKLPSAEPVNSTSVRQSLGSLLGEEKWAVIHFNVGLGDLVYRAPGMKSFRVLPSTAGGVRATTPEQYEANLRQLVGKLKKTGAKLIWASTTPIRSSKTSTFDLGSEQAYNEIASRVMKENEVPINDMYSYVSELIDMERPAGADPFTFDKKDIHPPVVQAIIEAL